MIACLIAWLIALLPAGLFSEMGREVPLSGLVLARKTYGWQGAFGFSTLFTVVNLGWFGLNTAVGALIGFFGPDFLPRFCYEIAPLPVVAGLVSAALFVVMALPRIRAGAADAAERVVVGE